MTPSPAVPNVAAVVTFVCDAEAEFVADNAICVAETPSVVAEGPLVPPEDSPSVPEDKVGTVIDTY